MFCFDFSNLFFSIFLLPLTFIFLPFPFAFLITFEFSINFFPPSFDFLTTLSPFLFQVFFVLLMLVHPFFIFLFPFFLFPFIKFPAIFFPPKVFPPVKYHLIKAELQIFIVKEVLHLQNLPEIHPLESLIFLHLHKISILDHHLTYL